MRKTSLGRSYTPLHARHITPFVGKQIDIAKAFGFEIPDGCDAKYKAKKSVHQ